MVNRKGATVLMYLAGGFALAIAYKDYVIDGGLGIVGVFVMFFLIVGMYVTDDCCYLEKGHPTHGEDELG